jgi:hypothetical protein
VDFRTAIAQANNLLSGCKGQPQKLAEADLQPFLADEEGTRGFFVAFLTEDWDFSSQTPPALLSALKANSTPSYSVIVRNLAMSSATEASHMRSGDTQKAYMSAAVADRTVELIKALDDASLWNLLSEMRKTLIGESGVFSDFLTRMKYGDDEKMAALAAIEQALAAAPRKKTDSLDLLDPFSE